MLYRVIIPSFEISSNFFLDILKEMIKIGLETFLLIIDYNFRDNGGQDDEEDKAFNSKFQVKFIKLIIVSKEWSVCLPSTYLGKYSLKR